LRAPAASAERSSSSSSEESPPPRKNRGRRTGFRVCVNSCASTAETAGPGVGALGRWTTEPVVAPSAPAALSACRVFGPVV
jgi:hypothetical protein